MSAAAELCEAGKLGNDLLGLARCDQIAGLVGKADDGVGVADVDPLGIRSAGIEGDAEGKVEAVGEGRDRLRLAIRADAAQNPDLVAVRVRQEDVAVGRGAHQTRLAEALRIHLHLEAFGRDGPCTLGPRNHAGTVVDRLIGLRLGKVGHSDLAADAGMLLGVVGEGGLAGKDGARLREERDRQRRHRNAASASARTTEGLGLRMGRFSLKCEAGWRAAVR